MATLFVVIVSLLVGAATYVATVRSGRRADASPSVGSSGDVDGAGATPVPDPPSTDDATVIELDRRRVDDERGSEGTAEDDRGGATEPPASRGSAFVTAPAATATAPAGTEPTATEPTEVAPTETAAMLPPVTVTGPEIPAPPPGQAYLRVDTEGPSWRDRVAGVLGIAILVAAGAAGVAFALYQLGSAINALIERFLNG